MIMSNNVKGKKSSMSVNTQNTVSKNTYVPKRDISTLIHSKETRQKMDEVVKVLGLSNEAEVLRMGLTEVHNKYVNR